MTALRAFFLATIVALGIMVATTLRWQPAQMSSTPAVDGPLAVQQIITFAPLSSQPFYGALRDAQRYYGCATPVEWQKHHSDFPETMWVQLTDSTGQPTWRLALKPWAFKDVGGYVRLLCPDKKAIMR